MNPVLSIIVPIYKVEQYLEQCLQSIFCCPQELLKQIEVITVNDGSPDNCQIIIDRFKKQYPKSIIVITQENQGLSIARNNGLAIANGDYIWFVDSDDWIQNDAIERILQTIMEHPNVDVFSSMLKKHFEKDGSYSFTPHQGKQLCTGFEYLLAKYPIGAVPRFIYKRKFLINNNLHFVPKLLHEDGIWGYSTIYLAKSIYVLEYPIYVYRIRLRDSIMSSRSIRSPRDLLKGHAILKDFMKTKVCQKDKDKYRIQIFGMIKTLLYVSSGLVGTQDYKDFLSSNISKIRKEALWVFLHNKMDLAALCIAVSPWLFSLLCKFK